MTKPVCPVCEMLYPSEISESHIIYRHPEVVAVLEEDPRKMTRGLRYPSVLVIPTTHAPNLLQLPSRALVQVVYAAVAVGIALQTVIRLNISAESSHEGADRMTDDEMDDGIVLQEQPRGLPHDAHYLIHVSRHLEGGVHAAWMQDSVHPSEAAIGPIVLRLRNYLSERWVDQIRGS